MSERFAFANIGADEVDKRAPLRVDDVRRPLLLRRLAREWLALVEDPPLSWPWLERARGLIPWCATALAHDVASERELALWGAPAGVVSEVNGRAFAVSLAERAEPVDSPFRLARVVDLRDNHAGFVELADVVAGWPRVVRRLTTEPAAFHVRQSVGPWWRESYEGRLDGTGAPACLAVVEPAREHVQDLTSAWRVDEHGEPHLLGSTSSGAPQHGMRPRHEFLVGAHGARAGSAHDEELVEHARVVVEAAAHAGYVGPCAVDAFLYAEPEPGRVGAVGVRGAAAFHARFTDAHVALGCCAARSPALGTYWRFNVDDVRVLEQIVPARAPEDDDDDATTGDTQVERAQS